LCRHRAVLSRVAMRGTLVAPSKGMPTPTAPVSRHVTVKEFVRQLWESFGRNQPFDLAAQLAYFAILSLFPFAMFLLTLVGYIPLHGLDQQILGAIYSVMPEAVAKLCDQTLHEII